MPDEHAKLSPSSSERWIACPASVRLSEEVPRDEAGSTYAEEGTMAHALAELVASQHFGRINMAEMMRRERAWKAKANRMPFVDVDEQFKHVAEYISLLQEIADGMENSVVLLEQRVKTGVPSCWGTSDAVIVSPDEVHIVDLKYGRGVRVEAEGNTQMRLYGVGALEGFGDLLGEVETVRMTIFQPRINNVSTATMGASELRDWRDSIIPIARDAIAGSSVFGPSDDACRWCPVRGDCRARVEFVTAQDFGAIPERLTVEELADVLDRLPGIKTWVNDVQDYALDLVYSKGTPIPGWKVVRSAGRTSIKDPTVAVQTLIDSGFNAEDVADFKAKPLGTLDKLVGGREVLQGLLGDLLTRSEGSPSLVPDTDQRSAISPAGEAVKDFDPI